MTAQQMRLIRPLTRQRPAAQVVLTAGALAIGPLLAFCRLVTTCAEASCLAVSRNKAEK